MAVHVLNISEAIFQVYHISGIVIRLALIVYAPTTHKNALYDKYTYIGTHIIVSILS